LEWQNKFARGWSGNCGFLTLKIPSGDLRREDLCRSKEVRRRETKLPKTLKGKITEDGKGKCTKRSICYSTSKKG